MSIFFIIFKWTLTSTVILNQVPETLLQFGIISQLLWQLISNVFILWGIEKWTTWKCTFHPFLLFKSNHSRDVMVLNTKVRKQQSETETKTWKIRPDENTFSILQKLNSRPICSEPVSRSKKRCSASVSKRPFLNQRTVGAGSPLTAHWSTAMLLIGSVWFCGPWWMTGGGRMSLSTTNA